LYFSLLYKLRFDNFSLNEDDDDDDDDDDIAVICGYLRYCGRERFTFWYNKDGSFRFVRRRSRQPTDESQYFFVSVCRLGLWLLSLLLVWQTRLPFLRTNKTCCPADQSVIKPSAGQPLCTPTDDCLMTWGLASSPADDLEPACRNPSLLRVFTPFSKFALRFFPAFLLNGDTDRKFAPEKSCYGESDVTPCSLIPSRRPTSRRGLLSASSVSIVKLRRSYAPLCVSAFRLSNNNNKWRWSMWTVAASRWTHSPKVVGLVRGSVSAWPSVCIHQTNRVSMADL